MTFGLCVLLRKSINQSISTFTVSEMRVGKSTDVQSTSSQSPFYCNKMHRYEFYLKKTFVAINVFGLNVGQDRQNLRRMSWAWLGGELIRLSVGDTPPSSLIFWMWWSESTSITKGKRMEEKNTKMKMSWLVRWHNSLRQPTTGGKQPTAQNASYIAVKGSIFHKIMGKKRSKIRKN